MAIFFHTVRTTPTFEMKVNAKDESHNLTNQDPPVPAQNPLQGVAHLVKILREWAAAHPNSASVKTHITAIMVTDPETTVHRLETTPQGGFLQESVETIIIVIMVMIMIIMIMSMIIMIIVTMVIIVMQAMVMITGP